MIYLLYGQPASGKTVLGKRLAEYLLTPYHIDGDEFRGFFTNDDYSKNGRELNIIRANAVVTFLNKTQDKPIVLSLVNPYKLLRRELKTNNFSQVKEVLLKSDRLLRKGYHCSGFEVGNPDFKLNTDRPVEVSWRFLKGMLLED